MNTSAKDLCAEDPLMPSFAGESEKLNREEENHSKTRKAVKKMIQMLSLMVLITTLIIITNRNPKIEDQIKALEGRVAELESKESYLRSDINVNVVDYVNEGSGDLELTVTVTDDEDFEQTGDYSDSIVQKMLGKWKQVKTIDMDAYLEAEDVSAVYKYMSGFFPPNMRFFEKEPGHFVQAFYVKLVNYYHEFPFNLDGTEFSFINHEDRSCTGFAKDEGNQISIVAEGGNNGPLLTWLYFEKGQLIMKTTLPDLDNITAYRVFDFVSSE